MWLFLRHKLLITLTLSQIDVTKIYLSNRKNSPLIRIRFVLALVLRDLFDSVQHAAIEAIIAGNFMNGIVSWLSFISFMIELIYRFEICGTYKLRNSEKRHHV